MAAQQKTVVVIGNGMVGHRFVEKLVEFDRARDYRIVTFCEEPRAAYDRVGLTSFFAHRDAEQLMIARLDWYREQGVDLHLGDRASQIDRRRRVVLSDQGAEIPYDHVVMATGSYPFVPPVDGITQRGVFVYRTIEDLEKIIEYGKHARRCAVIGGGLLGLEAAKAAYDLGLETHVIEFAPRLMPRQLDQAGSNFLVKHIEDLGVQVLATQTPFSFDMPVLNVPTLAPETTTALEDCPPICLGHVNRFALTAECSYGSDAGTSVRIHVRASYDGVKYDTVDLHALILPSGRGLSRRTFVLEPKVRFVKVLVQNPDSSESISDVKITAHLGS